MPKFAVPYEASEYLHLRLFGTEGGIPLIMKNVKFRNLRTFLAPSGKGIDQSRMLDFESGGMAGQQQADDDLIMDINCTTKDMNGALVFYDPWSEYSDDSASDFSLEKFTIKHNGHLCHVFELNSVKNSEIDFIGEIRSNSVSFEKIIFVSMYNYNQFNFDEKIFNQYLKNASSFYINVYDDETWLAADVEFFEFIE